PGVNRNVGGLGRVAIVGRAVERIRRQEPLHALDVPGRCAVALIHVAAPDPLRAGCHPDLVTRAVIADRSAGSMTAVEVIIARLLRIVAARIAGAVVDGIVPVVVVISVDSIPTAVMRLERVMRPANTGIRTGNHNVLAGVPKSPNLWSVRVLNSRFDCGWPVRFGRTLDWPWLWQLVVNNWVAFNASHARPSRQRLGKFAVTFQQNHVDDVERLILNVAVAQPLQNGRLRDLALAQQRFIHVAAFFSLGRQTGRAAQISLIGKYDEEFSLLTIGSVFHYPRRNLLVQCVNTSASRLAAATRSTCARRADCSYGS